MDGISRSRGWDKEIPHGVLPMEQLVLSGKWARKNHLKTVTMYVLRCTTHFIHYGIFINTKPFEKKELKKNVFQ